MPLGAVERTVLIGVVMRKLIRFGMLAAFTACSVPLVAQLTIHVSLSGNDKWSGTLKSSNRTRTDGPKKTLEGAREAIRKFKAANPGNWKGATVLIGPGNFYVTQTLTLGPEDSGTAQYPVVWKAQTPGKTFIDGGRVLTIWTSASRLFTPYLKKDVQRKVLQCNLKQMKILDTGKLSRRGLFIPTTQTVPELYWDSQRMQLARWPNNDWLRIEDDHDGAADSFRVADRTPATWRYDSDIWAYGYFRFNWADYYQKVASIDPATVTVKLDSAPTYGIAPKQRYYFVNVLEELDQPGEYYIDRKKQMLFFYPPVRSVGRRASLALLDAPLVNCSDSEYVRFEGLTFQNVRRRLAEIHRGTGNAFQGCVFRNAGTDGIYISGGTNNGMIGCDFTGLGEVAIRLAGGDRKSLTPGNNYATNCRVWKTANWVRSCYGAMLFGAGNILRNNRFELLPFCAVRIDGNNHLIEYNQFNRVCQEAGDSGAIGIGQDMTFQGNVIRYNLFQNIHGTQLNVSDGPNEIFGVMLDDFTSNTTVESNIFQSVDIPVQVGGGRDNKIRNNVFSDVHFGVYMQSRTPDAFESLGMAAKLAYVNHTVPPYSTAYPELARLLSDEPAKPKRNVLMNNVLVGSQDLYRAFRELVVTSSNDANSSMVSASNYVGMNPGFVDLGSMNVNLLPGSAAGEAGFQPFDSSRIGLQLGNGRTEIPAPAAP